MQRVLILGNCGAGKSTLATALAERTGLPLIQLDRHYWQPDWTPTHKSVWEPTVRKLTNRPRWIMDGNYAGTLDLRLPRADTVIFLDYPTTTCLWRISRRIAKYHGRVRPGMPTGCRERFDWPFYRYVATFNLRRRPLLLQKLAAYRADKHICVLKNDLGCAKFLGQATT